MKRTIFAALALAVLGGCAVTDVADNGMHEQTYTPLGTFVPRKQQSADERKFVDKEEFKRQSEMTATIESKQ